MGVRQKTNSQSSESGGADRREARQWTPGYRGQVRDEIEVVGKAAGGEWESSRRISNQSSSLRVRVEFGREAQCAVNNRRPCRGNRARPNGAAVPPATTAGEAKARGRKRQVGRTKSTASLEAAVFTRRVRARQVHRPSTFGGEGQHHQDSGDASQKMSVGVLGSLGAHCATPPLQTRCSESGGR